MEELDRLANRNDLAEIVDQRIARFVNGLRELGSRFPFKPYMYLVRL